jgi:hypothetical protein
MYENYSFQAGQKGDRFGLSLKKINCVFFNDKRTMSGSPFLPDSFKWEKHIEVCPEPIFTLGPQGTIAPMSCCPSRKVNYHMRDWYCCSVPGVEKLMKCPKRKKYAPKSVYEHTLSRPITKSSQVTEHSQNRDDDSTNSDKYYSHTLSRPLTTSSQVRGSSFSDKTSFTDQVFLTSKKSKNVKKNIKKREHTRVQSYGQSYEQSILTRDITASSKVASSDVSESVKHHESVPYSHSLSRELTRSSQVLPSDSSLHNDSSHSDLHLLNELPTQSKVGKDAKGEKKTKYSTSSLSREMTRSSQVLPSGESTSTASSIKKIPSSKAKAPKATPKVKTRKTKVKTAPKTKTGHRHSASLSREMTRSSQVLPSDYESTSSFSHQSPSKKM